VTDVDRAKKIADKQLTRRTGRRLEQTKRQSPMDKAASVIGSNREELLVTTDVCRLLTFFSVALSQRIDR